MYLRIFIIIIIIIRILCSTGTIALSRPPALSPRSLQRNTIFFKSVVKFSGIHYIHNIYVYMWQVYTAAALLRRGTNEKPFLSHRFPTRCHIRDNPFLFLNTEIGYMISDVQRIVSAAVACVVPLSVISRIPSKIATHTHMTHRRA